MLPVNRASTDIALALPITTASPRPSPHGKPWFSQGSVRIRSLVTGGCGFAGGRHRSIEQTDEMPSNPSPPWPQAQRGRSREVPRSALFQLREASSGCPSLHCTVARSAMRASVSVVHGDGLPIACAFGTMMQSGSSSPCSEWNFVRALAP